MFSCEICEMFKNTYFEEHLQTTASKPKIPRTGQISITHAANTNMEKHIWTCQYELRFFLLTFYLKNKFEENS